MMDLSEKVSGSMTTTTKSCADCQTTKTPLWRGGPAGPKSLCNACGIRYRKKRRALLGLSKSSTDPKKKEGKSRSGDHRDVVSLKLKLLSMGRDVLLQQRSDRSMVEKKQRKLGEEEQAAVLLMALSCGSVYA